MLSTVVKIYQQYIKYNKGIIIVNQYRLYAGELAIITNRRKRLEETVQKLEIEKRKQGLQAVSYTHLDVYKRQSLM